MLPCVLKSRHCAEVCICLHSGPPFIGFGSPFDTSLVRILRGDLKVWNTGATQMNLTTPEPQVSLVITPDDNERPETPYPRNFCWRYHSPGKEETTQAI